MKKRRHLSNPAVFLLVFHALVCQTVAVGRPDNEKNICYELNCICVNGSVRMTIHCENKGIDKIPDNTELPKEFTDLDFSKNKLASIKRSTFNPALDNSHIRRLDFTDNELSTIEDGSFQTFLELKRLTLKRNRLNSLSNNVFRGLEKLEELDLSYNDITGMEPQALAPCVSLRTWNIRFNPVPVAALLNVLLSASPQLEELDLHGIGVGSLPDELFINTPQIRRLILSSNHLRSVPGNTLARLRYLVHLDLDDNKIKEFPSYAFEGLESLEELELNNLPRLEILNERVFHTLKRLRVLSCSFNENLRTIHPNAFGDAANATHMWNLEEVHFRQNGLRSIPETLLPWNHIRYVDLYENPWHCDCKIAWLQDVNWQMKSEPPISCDTPLNLRYRLITEVTPEELLCAPPPVQEYNLSVSTTAFLVVFAIIFTVLSIFACFKLKLCNGCKALYQMRYKPVSNNNIHFIRSEYMESLPETELKDTKPITDADE